MPNTAKEQIVVDVTGWSPERRTRLLAAIAASDGLALPSPDEAPSSWNQSPDGWDSVAFSTLFAGLLEAGATVQVESIKRAFKNGGEISRDEVYEIGGYAPERSLRGFTRPVNRVIQRMREDGSLPEDADDLFVPIYDPKISGYQQAAGFRINPDVVEVLRRDMNP